MMNVRRESTPAEPIRWHPYAELFPWMEGAAFDELVEDVRTNGILEPIVLLDGAILDGRNRYMAARQLGIEYPVTEYVGSDPLAFVIAKNLARRHLSESQRAMVAAKLANLRDGQRSDLVEGLPIGRAAELLNVGERSVARAREVQEQGTPELSAAVERGLVSVSAAADLASLSKEDQAEIVARGEAQILQKAKQIRGERADRRRAERTARLIELSHFTAPLPERKYPIIYADPPWRYEHVVSISRDIENHYPTMSIDKICAMSVASIATEDAILFLCVPSPILEQGFQVIRAWGFDYRTCAVWVKDKIGMGYYVRNQHELLLIARRGDPPMPREADRPSSVITAPRTQHSAKPEEFYSLIEGMYPELPRVELFARSNGRPGWDVWGNQAEAA